MQEEAPRKKTPSLMGRCSGQGSACLGDHAEDRLSSRWVFGWGVVVCRKLGGKLGEIGSSESLDSKIEQAAELPSVLSTQKSALPSGRPSSDGVLSPGRPCETPSRRWTRTRAPRLTRSWSSVEEVGRPDADLVGAPHSVDLRERRVYLKLVLII